MAIASRRAVVAIGNAPTALFRLLEMLDEGVPNPRSSWDFRLGSCGAAESKAALAENSRGVPFLTIQGRRVEVQWQQQQLTH
jgi:precorrin isomerase